MSNRINQLFPLDNLKKNTVLHFPRKPKWTKKVCCIIYSCSLFIDIHVLFQHSRIINESNRIKSKQRINQFKYSTQAQRIRGRKRSAFAAMNKRKIFVGANTLKMFFDASTWKLSVGLDAWICDQRMSYPINKSIGERVHKVYNVVYIIYSCLLFVDIHV